MRGFPGRAQLSFFGAADEDEEPYIDAEALLWRPDDHRRCEHCRKRLVAFAGSTACPNPHYDAPDSGGSR